MQDIEIANMELITELITLKELDAVQQILQRKQDELQKMGNHYR